MITEIEGDLLELFDNNEFDIIAHGCNCFHTFGSGLARQIREKYYCAFKADLETRYADINKLGTYSKYSICSNKILNCYIQYSYGNDKCHLNYSALDLILYKINANFPRMRIGLPLIGCGLAGGDWGVVKPMIEKNLKNMNVTIVHYKPKD